jgi:hypothetical protein
MTWLPFGKPDMLKVDVEQAYDADNRLWSVSFRVLESKVGDLSRFCFIRDSNIIWVAGPCDDDAVPVHPAFNEGGATRTDKIKVICDTKASVEETVSGVLNDLDEYIRSKEALKDMVDAEVFVVRP